MSDKFKSLANSYGRSFFEAIKDGLGSAEIEKIETELKEWAELFKGDVGLFLKNATFERAEKTNVLEKFFSELKTSENVKKLILILCGQGHEFFLADAVKAFQKAKLDHQASSVAYVEAAFELTQKQTQDMREALEKKLNKKVLMNIRLTKELICGVRVRLGSLVFDASALGALNKLQEKTV